MVRFARVVSRQLISIIIVAYCIGFWWSATRLPEGPAVLYPQLVIGVLLVFVVADVVAGGWRAVHESTPDERSEPSDAPSAPRSAGDHLRAVWSEHHKTVVTTVATGLYIWVIPRLGFYIATAVYLAIVLPYLGVRRPLSLAMLWAGSLLVAWGLFGVLLSVRLPEGLLG